MILILGCDEDPHVQRVCRSLREMDVSYRILCSSHFTLSDSTTLQFPRKAVQQIYTISGEPLNLDQVTVVWYRRLPDIQVHPSITDEHATRFAIGEIRAFFRGLWNLLSDRIWLNPWQANDAAEVKLLQLKVADELGLRIPRTLLSTEPEEVAAFIDSVAGPVIYKPLTSFAIEPTQGESRPTRCVYTNVIHPDQVKAFSGQIRLAPCLFQEYIPKKLELRITVVGKTFLTASIDSQKSTKSNIDWRRYDLDQTLYEAYDLPAHHQASLRLLLDKLGLVYGAIDCILTPNDELVFLEVNPGGQWLWVEELTGMRIGHAIASYLAESARKVALPAVQVSL